MAHFGRPKRLLGSSSGVAVAFGQTVVGKEPLGCVLGFFCCG
jgi:hypothetical protein